jgi:heme oxygenase
MTWVHDPYKHKNDYRSLEKRRYISKDDHPLYGNSLRKVIAPEPTEDSFIERLTNYYMELSYRDAVVITVAIIAAILLATVIVAL